MTPEDRAQLFGDTQGYKDLSQARALPGYGQD